MGKLGHIGMIRRITGTVCGGFWRAATTGVGALFTRLPYQTIKKTRLTQLEDCETALRVLLAQDDRQRAQVAYEIPVKVAQ